MTDERTSGGANPSRIGAVPLLPVPRRHVRVLTVGAICGIAVLNGADEVTTKMLLRRTAVEANPLAGLLLSNGALLWVKLGIVLVLGVVALRVPPRLGVLVVSWAVLGLYAAAVLSNVLILRIT